MMKEELNDSVLEIVERYWAIYRALLASASVNWTDLDLSGAQMKALFVLARAGTASIGDVADALRVGLPTGSHLVNRLVQAGLAERAEDPDDRRRKIVRLTPEGTELVSQLRRGSVHQLRGWVTQLDPPDRAALLQGLRALTQVVQPEMAGQVVN